MALVSDESMPLVAYSRIICSHKVALELENFTVRTRLYSLVVEADIPDSRCRILTKASFCLVRHKLLAGTVCTQESRKIMGLDGLVFEKANDLVCAHRSRRHQVLRRSLLAILAANEHSCARS